MDKIKKLFSEENLAIICLTIVILVSFVIFYSQDKWDALPPFFLTCVTSIFSFFAYKHSQEKFRLDLLERRFEIYKNALEFCSHIVKKGNLKYDEANKEEFQKALIAAHESFLGIGLHKTKSLFGKDINDLFDEISDHYSWLISFDETPDNVEERREWVKEKHYRLKNMWHIINTLPEHFRPYIYFGEYKNRSLKCKL